MITLTFLCDGKTITGFEFSGHSGYAKAGYDIVCASISTAVTLVECAINDVLKAGAIVIQDDKKPLISLRLSPGKPDEKTYEACIAMLQALYMTVKSLTEEYGQYLCVELEKADDF